MKNKEDLKKHDCGCGAGCTCGDDCNCNDEHRCNENCTCNHDDHCSCGCDSHENCGCGDDCSCHGKENEYLELAQRLKAEFDNYKRRNADLSAQSFNNGVASTVTRLLPAIDSFKQAKANIEDEDTLKGLSMIEGLILSAFKELNVEKIDCLGKEFNPNLHNAVLTGQDETKPDGVVLEEYQEGFKMGDRIIRYSVVKINKLS